MRSILISAILLGSAAAAPLIAQNDMVSLRVEKLEKEMKAVQRKVFPNGAPVQPEMGGASPTGMQGSTSAVSDLTTRIDTLEASLKEVTGKVESQSSRLTKIEATNKALEGRIAALEKSAAPPEPVVEAPVGEPKTALAPEPKATTPKPAPAKPKKVALADPVEPVTTQGPQAKPKSKPDAKTKSKIDAVEIPRTGDGAEDQYVYGFRLWQAKLYPEAEQQLENFIKKYPKHQRVSFAGNLLGRAYFDEGKPARAAVAFYQNYKRDEKGERAAESVYYLGVSLTKLKRLTEACNAFAEFKEKYGSAAAADLKAKVAKGRTDAKCAA